MESIKIDNVTYLVRRSFIGQKTIPEIVRDRLQTENSQVLPLTKGGPASYNYSGNGIRCEEAQ